MGKITDGIEGWSQLMYIKVGFEKDTTEHNKNT